MNRNVVNLVHSETNNNVKIINFILIRKNKKITRSCNNNTSEEINGDDSKSSPLAAEQIICVVGVSDWVVCLEVGVDICRGSS